MRTLKHRFRTFLRDEDGLILVEGLIMMPLMVWALVAMFIYWDVFRTINVTQKASYGIADLLSRQRADIAPATFTDGLQNVMAFLTPGGHTVRMRITSFECIANALGCNATNGSYRLLFSKSPGDRVPALTQATIQQWKTNKIPILNNGESVFVLETTVDFQSQMKSALAGLMVGVNDATYGSFIVTRPRHRRLCLQGTTTCT